MSTPVNKGEGAEGVKNTQNPVNVDYECPMGMNFTRYFNAPTLVIIHTGHEKRASYGNGSKEIFYST